MKREIHACDRCGEEFTGGVSPSRFGLRLTLHYHHEATIELCARCEEELPFFLGRHPRGSSLDKILAGTVSGDGYPSKERIAQARRERGLPAWCPTCMREGKMPPGEHVKTSGGGTATFSCGHTVGK